ncbi:MAG: hypothetical protein PHV82_06170 [Victivallaceae bacterium]|nr:hypothetical protein [Victivallaceae bacterium]
MSKINIGVMMFKKIVFLYLAFCCFTVSAAQKVLVEYFYQPNCEDCRKVSEFIIKPMNEKYGSKILLKKYDLSEEKNFLLLVSILEKQHDDSNAHVYLALNRNRILAGYAAMEKNLFRDLEALNTMPLPKLEKPQKTIESIGKRLTLFTVIAAGFIDGINPCVFSALIFFMSLMAVAKIRGVRFFIVGTAYCLACFLTYLLLGFGLFKVLKSLNYFSWLRTGLNWMMVILLLAFAFLSFRDALVFIRSGGNSRNVALQLPHKIKLLVHKVMRRGLKFEYLFCGAFFIGVAVTVLESVCTGQVYVPTLVLLANKTGMFSRWFTMLLLYNLAFIIPLIVIFVSMFSGISVLRAVRLTRSNLLLGKIALGVFFLALAAITIILSLVA